jgi:alkylation response protein AidB-like acyl-CoA dehydrogenase
MSLETPAAPKRAIYDALLATADRLAADPRATAADRDRANETPRNEVELLRENDLLQVQEPIAYGGSDLNYAEAAQLVRRIARGDTSIAHLLGYHYAHTRVARLFGTPAQADAQSRRNGEQRLFWGGVQNPRGGSDVVLTDDGDGFRLDGRRIGQRLTDSGGVELHDVRVARDEVLGDELRGRVLTPYQTLVTPHWQLAFVNFYIGTAEGAIEEALEWTRANAAPWESSGVERATDDPYILETVGEITAQVRAAALLADRAGDALQHALDVGEGLTEDQRAEAAVAVYEAKVVTTQVALDATSRLFEIQGARATTAAYGFDRHWRNVRTHTVHDPVAYKAREVGDWALNRRASEFSLYR